MRFLNDVKRKFISVTTMRDNYNEVREAIENWLGNYKSSNSHYDASPYSKVLEHAFLGDINEETTLRLVMYFHDKDYELAVKDSLGNNVLQRAIVAFKDFEYSYVTVLAYLTDNSDVNNYNSSKRNALGVAIDCKNYVAIVYLMRPEVKSRFRPEVNYDSYFDDQEEYIAVDHYSDVYSRNLQLDQKQNLCEFDSNVYRWFAY